MNKTKTLFTHNSFINYRKGYKALFKLRKENLLMIFHKIK